MKDQHSNSDDDDEVVRFRMPSNPSIEEFMVYDPEYDAYFAPGTPSTFDCESWLREFRKRDEADRRGGLITVDELRAAGALDVPAAWRKSLGVERDLFSDLVDDDDRGTEQEKPKQIDLDSNDTADDVRG